MQIVIALLLSAVLTFGTAACGSKTETVSPEPTYSTDENFAELVKDNTAEFDTLSDPAIVGLANTICDGFEAGMSFEDVAMIFFEAKYDVNDAGYFLGAATVTYCPEYADRVM